MAKKDEQQEQEQLQVAEATVPEASASTPAGSATILIAPTPETVTEAFEKLKASHPDATLAAGAVGYSAEKRQYSLRVDIL